MGAFSADVRRCVEIGRERQPTWRLIAGSYGLQALLAYRLGRWLLRAGRRYYLWPLLPACWPIYYLLSRYAWMAYDIRLELSAEIGPGFYIGHFGAIRVRRCRIGANCSIGRLTNISAAGDCPGTNRWRAYHWFGCNHRCRDRCPLRHSRESALPR